MRRPGAWKPPRRRSREDVLIETSEGLACPNGGFHIDPWGAVPRALITHAHGDHARAGSAAYLCAAPAVPLLRRRFGPDAAIEGLAYGQSITLGTIRISFHPAGHILGSAQVRLQSRDGVWVVSGDYKRAPDPTCAPFEVVRCDTFVTETTFGLPIYQWDAADEVIADIVGWWKDAGARGQAAVLFCYTIGKAQRLLAELARFTDRPVLVHGMMQPIIDVYRDAGIRMLPTSVLVERPRGASVAGALVLAPPSARGTPWMRRLGDFADALTSGLMRVRGVRRQRAYDRGFVLSDHADWPAILTTIRETGASRVLATHGHAETVARYLAEYGVTSGVLRTAWDDETGADDRE